METTTDVDGSRELAHEQEITELKREFAQKRAELEKKYAKKHGEDIGISGAAADTKWTYDRYGSPRERDEEMILEGFQMS